MRRRLVCGLILMALLGLGCAAFVVVARGVSRRFLFPTRYVISSAKPADFATHTLTARDGVLVHAIELPAAAGARTVVHFHNNRETAEARIDLARAIHARGMGVLLVEYRGYGASGGAEPSERGLYLDAEAALDMLAARGIGPQNVVLWGTSLGTGVAAEMARRGRGARLVLVTPYTSIPDLVTDLVPLAPASMLLADHFDTLSKSADIHVPTIVVHGDADEIVPFWMGQRLAQTIRGARLVRIAGGHHGDLFARGGDRLLSEIFAP